MRPQMAYLGWQRRGNFGDDLLHDFWSRALVTCRIAQVPLYRNEWPLAIALGLSSRVTRRDKRSILLGGGTIFGYATWAHHIEVAQRVTAAERVLALGCGAPDLTLDLDTSNQSVSLQAWKNLKGLEVLGMRGPRSQKTAAELGFNAPIVGDPGLFWPKTQQHTRPTSREEDLVSVNLGHSPNHGAVLAFSPQWLAETLTRAFPAARFQVLVLAHEDYGVSARLEQELRMRCPGKVGQVRGGVATIMAAVARSRVVISQRLHGLVAGAASSVVPVALPYEGKSFDFMESIELTPFIVNKVDQDSAIDVLLKAWRHPSEQLISQVEKLWGEFEPRLGEVRDLS